MSYDPYPSTLEGRKLSDWLDYELEHRLRRAYEQALDAYRYGGPGHAAMYEDIIRKVCFEQCRREADAR